jgi:hypothetical protein
VPCKKLALLLLRLQRVISLIRNVSQCLPNTILSDDAVARVVTITCVRLLVFAK